jgi:two-component system nitrate/nitrite response regulator NarL
MAATTWDYEYPFIASEECGNTNGSRVRMLTYIRNGLFADAMHSIMEREHFDVIATHRREDIEELAAQADVCMIDLAIDGADDLVLEISGMHSHLRVVALATSGASKSGRGFARRVPNVHVASGDSLDRVLAILRGDECGGDRRRPSVRLRETDDRDLHRLTRREAEVLEGLLDGENTKVLAARLGVSPATARTHVQSVLSKLGVHSRLEAVALVNGGAVDWRHDILDTSA